MGCDLDFSAAIRRNHFEGGQTPARRYALTNLPLNIESNSFAPCCQQTYAKCVPVCRRRLPRH